MKKFSKPPLALLLIFAIYLTGCESPTSVDDGEQTAESISFENEEMTAMLVEELSLTSVEEAQVEATIKTVNVVNRQPGWEWTLAARLDSTLSDERKEKLFELTERIEEYDLFGLVCFVGPGGLTGPDWRTTPNFVNRLHVLRLIRDLLTEEQIEQIRNLQARYHANVRSLIAEVRAGTLSREEFVEQVKDLVSKVIAEIRALLTEEQVAALLERIEARKMKYEDIVVATKRAMYSAIDASEDQVNSVETLCDRLSEEKDALFSQFELGELSRQDLKTALNALNEIEKEELMQILDDSQFDIVLIHKAILLRWRRIDKRLHRDPVSRRFNAGDGGPLFGTSEARQ